MPEALTEWKFLGFAHDRQMRSGYLTDTTVTAKDLMVEPNPPRFVREGDVIEFTVKVTNQSAARVAGKVSLTLSDARTLGSSRRGPGQYVARAGFRRAQHGVPHALVAADDPRRLRVPHLQGRRRDDPSERRRAGLSAGAEPPDSCDGIAAAADSRDRRPRSSNSPSCSSPASRTRLIHQSLTVQMVSQPAWYAVMALPYLMEYPYECSEQIFNRLYANALASYIAGSDPKIRRIFDQWKATPALDSPLEKNEDLKGIALEETPWVRQAIGESEARRNVGILFDQNRLTDETSRALFKLKQMQYADGLWPWFPGCRGNEYITLYITTGFGRLRHLGVSQIDVSCAVKALDALDRWMDEWYRDILDHGDKDAEPPQSDDRLVPVRAELLPGGSAHRGPIPGGAATTGSARPGKYWLSLWRQSQAHLAIALKRFGDTETPAAIMKSIKEFSVTSEEMGMYLAGHRAKLVVAPGADRDAGPDDRGLRRGHGRRPGGRGLPGLAAQAEADPGLEDHQGHGRRGLRPAASRHGHALLRRPGPGRPRRRVDRARERRGRHRVLRGAIRPRRDRARDGSDHRQEDR